MNARILADKEENWRRRMPRLPLTTAMDLNSTHWFCLDSSLPPMGPSFTVTAFCQPRTILETFSFKLLEEIIIINLLQNYKIYIYITIPSALNGWVGQLNMNRARILVRVAACLEWTRGSVCRNRYDSRVDVCAAVMSGRVS